jgi:hypothetical protein
VLGERTKVSDRDVAEELWRELQAVASEEPDVAIGLIGAAIRREREACAAIADEEAAEKCIDPYCCQPLAREIAARIRARGQR